MVDGTVVGDRNVKISGVSDIRNGSPGTITFLSDQKYKKYAAETGADAILTSDESVLAGRNGIVVDNSRMAITKILQKFEPDVSSPTGIHKTALVDKTAKIGNNVSIGAFAVIEANAVIGENSVIGHHSVVGENSKLGSKISLHSHVHIYHHCELGNNISVHSGTVIGSDGFGFVTDKDEHVKIPQIGRVVIEDNVEIGANCTIDRGSVGDTVIGENSKFDNLVHIAHNVSIGKGCLFAAQTAVAGSSVIGDFCMFGGKSCVADHVTIGDRAVFAALSAATKSLPGGKTYAGMPAREIREQHKKDAVLVLIEGLKKRLNKLEKNS